MSTDVSLGDGTGGVFPTPLSSYPTDPGSLLHTLQLRAAMDPLAVLASVIFVLAILHTFAAAKFTELAHRVPGIGGEILHFLGEVEVVFGLWVIPLLIAITSYTDWETAVRYLDETVIFTEPMFVVVIMALASTRPVVAFAEGALRRIVDVGAGTPAAWWLVILTIGPLLGSFITEPGAMTICALLLARQFYDLQPSTMLKYATLGLLFVNISIGGTLTHFAAPPILMVARPWGWDTAFVLGHFGWRAVAAILVSTLAYFMFFRRELAALAQKPPVPDIEPPDEEAAAAGPPLLPVPAWVTVIHLAFMGWTVFNSHYPALFLGGFLFFLGFMRATAVHQSRAELRGPLLVGFFLAGLVIHGGLQAWWIAPVLASLSELPLYFGATALTAFNDNALITYLATLVPNLSDSLRVAVVEGAVTGGGLTVIANAPNPAGQSILSRFFADESVHPLWLFAGALVPTLVAVAAFRLI
jgi:hypothetical protein